MRPRWGLSGKNLMTFSVTEARLSSAFFETLVASFNKGKNYVYVWIKKQRWAGYKKSFKQRILFFKYFLRHNTQELIAIFYIYNAKLGIQFWQRNIPNAEFAFDKIYIFRLKYDKKKSIFSNVFGFSWKKVYILETKSNDFMRNALFYEIHPVFFCKKSDQKRNLFSPQWGKICVLAASVWSCFVENIIVLKSDLVFMGWKGLSALPRGNTTKYHSVMASSQPCRPHGWIWRAAPASPEFLIQPTLFNFFPSHAILHSPPRAPGPLQR